MYLMDVGQNKNVQTLAGAQEKIVHLLAGAQE